MELIDILQIVVSIALVISILLQNRGSGLSAAFGGGSGGYHTKRGIEKFLLYFSIGLAIAFVSLAIISIIIN